MSQVNNLLTRLNEDDKKILNEPDNKCYVYRYMTFDKFYYILSKKTLYFPNSLCFSDKLEGDIGSHNRESLRQQGEVWNCSFFDDNYIERAHTYISCWTLNPPNSLMMWKLGVLDQDYLNNTNI